MKSQPAFKPIMPDGIGWPDQPKPYNPETHSSLIQYMDRTGASLRDLVKEIRINRTSLSQYVNYKYEGNVQEMERKIEGFLRKKAPKTVSDGICETSVFRTLTALFNFCTAKRVIGAGIGDSGTGKTFAALEFVRKHPTATLITADPTKRSITKVVRLIQHNIQSRGGGSSDDILNGIIERLRDSHQFLIFDESHFFGWSEMEIVRAIWDATGIGILFLAQPRFYIRMKGHKWYLWDQIISRIMISRNLNTITREDVKLISDSIHPGLPKSCLSYLHEIVQKPGKLRVLTALLKQADEVSKRQRIPLTLDLLKDVRNVMHIWK